MAIAPPAAAPANLNDCRRGRPPLLAQSARSFQSIDRFLMPGASSSAATSASAMAEPELTAPVGHENVNPNANTSPCPNPNLKPNHNPNSDATPSSTTIPVPKKPSRGRPRKNPSPNANNPNSDLNRNRNRNSGPNPNSNPSHSPSPDAAHDLTAVPVPKKTSRGRPRKNPSPASTGAAISAIDADSHRSSNVGLAETAEKEYVKTPNKRVKRKCTMAKGPLDSETKDSLSKQFQSEVASLVKFYHEDGKIKLEMSGGVSNTVRRAEIAILIEESSLPFSSLVADVLQRLRATAHAQGGSDPTLASLRSTVLSIGERMCFGIPNSDADVLEDDSDACLWCWEVRDIKLLPETHRSLITARRRKRRKIAERIAALSAMITALTMAHDEDKEQMLLMRAEEALLKTESEDFIRIAVSQWQQKKAAKEAEKEVMIKEKEALKEQYRLLREMEKEQKRLDKEEEKKKLQQEKEKERLEKEASKRSQKEAIRQEKELRRQQEEVEKELKRKEKEAADLKKQAAVQKQATIMGRFLQSKKDQADSVSSLQDDVETGHRASHDESIHEKVIHDMDQEMLHQCDRPIKDFFSSHVTAWKRNSLLSSTRKSKRWCQRRMPKLSPVNELRLQGGPSDGCLEGADDIQAETVLPNAGLKRSRKEFEESELKADKLEPEWDDSGAMDFFDLGEQDGAIDPQKFSHFQNKRRKLLQFDKSHRPAYYGSFSKRSEVIRPRNPLKMDPNLDYENDSDEEWEEEDPGESLSDCDKDEEDEKGDADEDDEAADGFVVPDGYLSESEVAHVDDSESESDAENSSHDSSTKVTVDGTVQIEAEQSLLKFARQRKALEHLTDQALRCNRPYIICNFHPNNPSATVGKTDRLCLEALRVCPLTLEIPIEVPQDPQLQEKVDVDYSKFRKQKAKKLLPETALCEMVEILLSSTHGMKKLVDVLSTKFPTASRSQLRIKVREIADYVDNHWQVKKEIIEHLGLTPPCPQAASTPDPVTKSPAIQLKPITKFFSKRCLPPENAGFDDPSPKKSK